MDTANTWFDGIIVQPIQTLLSQLSSAIPKLVGALLVFLVGWFIAQILQGLIVRVLKALGIDQWVARSKFSTLLSKGSIRRKPSELLGAMVYWILMLSVIMVTFNTLGLTIVVELLHQIVGFIPHTIAAVCLSVIGIFAASFLASTVRSAARNAGMVQANLLGQLVHGIILMFAAVAALQQLQVKFVGEAFLIILAGFSLGMALAFGLGCKDLAGQWVAKLLQGFRTGKKLD